MKRAKLAFGFLYLMCSLPISAQALTEEEMNDGAEVLVQDCTDDSTEYENASSGEIVAGTSEFSMVGIQPGLGSICKWIKALLQCSDEAAETADDVIDLGQHGVTPLRPPLPPDKPSFSGKPQCRELYKRTIEIEDLPDRWKNLGQ